MSAAAGSTRTRRRYEEPAPRGPFESAQFLIEPAGHARRQIDNDHGEAVLLSVAAPAPLTLLPQRTFAFYDLRTDERLIEVRPEYGAARGAHRLIDASGLCLARFELQLPSGRWLCRRADGPVIASATAYPRLTTMAALGRGRWIRHVHLAAEGRVIGMMVRQAPEFDGHDLVDLSHDTDGLLDRRVALALALLAS